MPPYDICIAGAGPAGSSAALCAARAGWKTLVIDGGLLLGALGAMPAVYDFPGVPNGTSGATLLNHIRGQATHAGAEFREAEITSTAMGMSGKQLFSRDGAKFEGRAIILATGGCRRPTMLPGEKEFVGRGVAYSVLRDGPLFCGKPVIVYGKGGEAARAALELSRLEVKVTFVIPSSKLDLPEPQQEELRKHPGIALVFSASVKQINGPDIVTGVTILAGGQEKELVAEGIFLLHQGHKINNLHLAGTVDCSPDGLVLVSPQLETSIPGVFAAGDILTGEPQIAAIAAAQGIMAALRADKYLRNNLTNDHIPNTK